MRKNENFVTFYKFLTVAKLSFLSKILCNWKGNYKQIFLFLYKRLRFFPYFAIINTPNKPYILKLGLSFFKGVFFVFFAHINSKNLIKCKFHGVNVLISHFLVSLFGDNRSLRFIARWLRLPRFLFTKFSF